MVKEHRYLPAWTLMAVSPSLVQFPPVPLQTPSLSISLSIQRRAQSQTFYDKGSDVRILTPTESCRCQERVGPVNLTRPSFFTGAYTVSDSAL